jgi:hypothetical protein
MGLGTRVCLSFVQGTSKPDAIVAGPVGQGALVPCLSRWNEWFGLIGGVLFGGAVGEAHLVDEVSGDADGAAFLGEADGAVVAA